VVAVCGDGGFLMTCQELVTAAVENVPVVALVMHDNCLGMIRQLQHAFYGKRLHVLRSGRRRGLRAPGGEHGVPGHRGRPRGRDRARPVAALESGRPCVLDCRIDAPANVYPMVTGATLMDYIE